MVNEIFSNAKTRMNKAIEHCSNEISQIRTGRASTNIIDNIKVDYYGTPTPLKNISHVSSPDAQLLMVQPFDPTSLELIEKAILLSTCPPSKGNTGSILNKLSSALNTAKPASISKSVIQ